MSNKHRVEYDGLVFKRTSAGRKYTHLVITPISLAERLEDAEEGARDSWKGNQAFHKSMADSTWPGIKQYPEQYPPEEIERRAIEGRAWLDLGEQGHVDQARARALKYWRESFPDRDAGWCVRGWCGRLDLAMKSAKAGDKILEVTP